jgi:hypothetical protein
MGDKTLSFFVLAVAGLVLVRPMLSHPRRRDREAGSRKRDGNISRDLLTVLFALVAVMSVAFAAFVAQAWNDVGRIGPQSVSVATILLLALVLFRSGGSITISMRRENRGQSTEIRGFLNQLGAAGDFRPGADDPRYHGCLRDWVLGRCDPAGSPRFHPCRVLCTRRQTSKRGHLSNHRCLRLRLRSLRPDPQSSLGASLSAANPAGDFSGITLGQSTVVQ